MDIKEKAITLFKKQKFPSEQTPLAGVSNETIKSFQKKNNIIIPADLIEWLHYSNGSFTGPGGLYGLSNGIKQLDVENYYSYYPAWKNMKWIPISGDGCGNSYVIDANENSPTKGAVFFIDTSENSEVISFIVASDLWHFLFFLMKNEEDQTGWPFSKEYVLSIDEKLGAVDNVSLPWKN